jgi:hypothetical protein
MRVFVCFKEGATKKTKIVDNVNTQRYAEEAIKDTFPNASILYTSIMSNATEGKMSNINMLSVM